MTLDQLRIFVAVAERQHVTRAARALNLAQSAASAAIAGLEARHGVTLFQRIGRGVRLTAEGEIFLDEARAVLARAEAAALRLAELGSLATGRLVVQASQTIASYWLPRHLVAFRRAHPGIAIQLVIGNTARVAAAVQEGSAELGFVEGPVHSNALDSRLVARDQLLVVAAPAHPWCALPALSGADLQQGEWVLREPGSGTRSAFESGLAGLGVAPSALRVVLELPSNESVRAAVEAGMGATALSASVAAPSIEAGLLTRLPVVLPEREYRLLRRKDRPASHAALALAAMFTV